MSLPTLSVSPKLLQEIEDEMRPGWRRPEDAAVKNAGTARESAEWYEVADIVEVGAKMNDKDPTMMQLLVVLQVNPDSQHTEQIGKKQWQRFFIVPEALSNTNHPKHDMSRRNLQGVTSLIRSLGADPQDYSDLTVLFSPDESELLGKTVRVKAREYKNKNGETQLETSRFYPSEG
jgi:hypothetical protein